MLTALIQKTQVQFLTLTLGGSQPPVSPVSGALTHFLEYRHLLSQGPHTFRHIHVHINGTSVTSQYQEPRKEHLLSGYLCIKSLPPALLTPQNLGGLEVRWLFFLWEMFHFEQNSLHYFETLLSQTMYFLTKSLKSKYFENTQLWIGL